MSRRFQEYRFYIPPDVLVEFHSLASSLKIHTVSPEEAQIWIVDSSTSDYSNLQQIWSLVILDVEWLRACSEAGNKFIGEREDFGGYRLDSCNSYEPTGSRSIPAHYPQHDAMTPFAGLDPYEALPPSHVEQNVAYDAQLPYSGRVISTGAEWTKEESLDANSQAGGSEGRRTEEPEEKQDEWSNEERMTLLDIMSAAGTQTKAFITFSEQSDTRTANMATHYYRKNREWYETQLAARGVALTGTDAFSEKEKNDLMDLLSSMPPSKAFRHFASSHLHRSAKSSREQYDSNLQWYTTEMEKKGGIWSGKEKIEKEKQSKPEAAASRVSTWQKHERDYMVESIATTDNLEAAWKKVHEKYPKRSTSAIKAQYQSGLAGRRATWNALVEAYKNGKTDLSDVVYLSASRSDDKETHAAAIEAVGGAPPVEKDQKYWTLEEKEILLELLVEEDNLMECFRKFHVACPNRTVSSVKAQFYQKEDWYRERLEEQGIVKDADFGTHGATPWSEAEIETLKECMARVTTPNGAFDLFRPRYPDRSANAVKMQARALKTKGAAKYLERGRDEDDEDDFDDIEDDRRSSRASRTYRPAAARATRATRARKRELEIESESEQDGEEDAEEEEEPASSEPTTKKIRLKRGSISTKSFAEAMQDGEEDEKDDQMDEDQPEPGPSPSLEPQPYASSYPSSSIQPNTAAFTASALPLPDQRIPQEAPMQPQAPIPPLPEPTSKLLAALDALQ